MKKRITALLLCLVMVFSLIPTTVWAAVCTVDIKVRVIPVYLDDSKYLGYDVEYANDVNLNLSCQYTTKHSSGANHSIKIKDFHPDNIGMTCTRSGYEWIYQVYAVSEFEQCPESAVQNVLFLAE